MRRPPADNKYLRGTGAAMIFALSLLCAGCGGYTRYNLKDTTYDKAWQACIEVRDEYGPMGVKVRRYGMNVFETGSDKDKGVMSFVTGEALISHVENTIRLKDLGNNTVQVSVKSADRIIFLPWMDRSRKNEERLLSEIRYKLGERMKSSFEIRLVSKSAPSSEGIIPGGEAVFTSLDLIDAAAEHPPGKKPTVSIILRDKKKFSALTAENTGHDLFIVGNGTVLAVYTIKGQVSNGILEIDNNFSAKEARGLVDAIWLSAFGTTSEN